MPETHAKEMLEIKEAVDTLSQGFAEARSAIESETKESIKQRTGELEEKLTKISEDLSTKHEELEEKQRKLDAALNRVNFSDRESIKKQISYREGKEIQKWMKANQGVPGASIDLGNLFSPDVVAQQKTMSVSNDENGGFHVVPQVEQMLLDTRREYSMFAQMARTVNITQGDSIERIIDMDTDVGALRDDETEFDANAETGTPTFAQDKIYANFMGVTVIVTQQLLDDSGLDMASYIQMAASRSFRKKSDTEYFLGRGTGRSQKEARGILTYDAGTSRGQIEQVNSGAPGAFDYDTILKFHGTMKDDYIDQAVYFAKRQVIWSDLMSLKSDAGDYILRPDPTLPGKFRLNGNLISAAPDMPAAATDSLSLALINVADAYTIVNRSGIPLVRDNLTGYPKVKFRFRIRTGGEVEIFEAVKLMKLSA